jgi:hypothetical protein
MMNACTTSNASFSAAESDEYQPLADRKRLSSAALSDRKWFSLPAAAAAAALSPTPTAGCTTGCCWAPPSSSFSASLVPSADSIRKNHCGLTYRVPQRDRSCSPQTACAEEASPPALGPGPTRSSNDHQRSHRYIRPSRTPWKLSLAAAGPRSRLQSCSTASNVLRPDSTCAPTEARPLSGRTASFQPPA